MAVIALSLQQMFMNAWNMADILLDAEGMGGQ